MSVDIILLAAGGSTRLGRPKQLLPYAGSTLLRHAVEIALDLSVVSRVIVVLGANADACREAITGLPVTVVVNDRWEQGMGSSIAAGVAEMTRDPDQPPDAALLMLCDQPGVIAGHLERLIETFRAGDIDIAASSYSGSSGVPALFSRRLFGELLALDPARGAKSLIEKNANRVAILEFPAGAIDIDTPADYERLICAGDGE